MTAVDFDWIKFGLAVLGSSVISAMINTGWNIYSKKKDIEDKKKKDLEEREHELLMAMSWVDNLSIAFYDSMLSIKEYVDDMHNMPQGYNPKGAPNIEEPKEVNLKLLPVGFRAEILLIGQNFKYSSDFIHAAFQYWADADDCYIFELQRLAFYGVQIAEFSDKFRDDLYGKSEKLSDAHEYFSSEKEKYIKRCLEFENVTFLPEIEKEAKGDN